MSSEDDVHTPLDAAYHAKYDRHGQAIVGSVTRPHAIGATLRFLPQP